MARTVIRVKRAYDPPEEGDGYRVLVDRLWPRGLRREEAALHAWWRDLAPRHELRRWFHADPGRWPEFCRRYREELEALPAGAVAEARAALARPVLTLLTAARAPARSRVPVLREWLGTLAGGGPPRGASRS